MSVVQLDPGRPWLSALTRVVRRAVLVAVTVAVVDVTFGYAVTGVHDDVLAGAGSGLAIGVGLQPAHGLFAGLLPDNALGPIIVPTLALAIGERLKPVENILTSHFLNVMMSP